MYANIIKTQIFKKLKYNPKGQSRLHKVILKFQNHLLLRYIICLTTDFLKTFHKMKFDLKGHPRSYKTNFMPKFSFIDRFWSKFVRMLISWRLNFSINYILPISYMLCISFVIFFTLRPSDLITIDLRSYEQLSSLFYWSIEIKHSLLVKGWISS